MYYAQSRIQACRRALCNGSSSSSGSPGHSTHAKWSSRTVCVYVAVAIIMISWMDEMLVRLSDEVVAMRGSDARVLRRCGSGSCEMDPKCIEGEC